MIVIKDFQPITFKVCDIDNGCDCGDASCNQLALLDDKFSFQLQNEANFLLVDTILNGDFATNDLTSWNQYDNGGTIWSGATGSACVVANVLSKILWQAQTITDCKCYRLVFDLLTDIPTSCQLDIILDDGTDTWTEIIGTYTDIAAQTDIVLPFCADQNWTRIGFRFSGAGCGEVDFCIDNIELRQYDIDIKIYDCCDDSLIDTIDDCDITFGENHVLVEGIWSDYVSDKSCYKFCIEDLEIIVNGTFADGLNDWDQDSSGTLNWQDGGGYAEADGIGGTTNVLSQEIELTPGCEYTIDYDVTANLSTVSLYIDDILIETVSANSSYTFTAKNETVKIAFTSTLLNILGASVQLDNVSIEVDICSYCICVAESHPFCTNFLTSKHHEDTTDFDFETDTDFKFYMRLNSRIINPRYLTEEELYLSSFGVSTLNYALKQKVWEFQINRIPEYMLDALQSMFGFDELTIAGTRYVKMEGDLEPRWNRGNTKLAALSVEIKKGTDNRVSN